MAQKQCTKISGAGVQSLNGIFSPQSPKEIPLAFPKVYKEKGLNADNTWQQLTDLSTPWYLKQNGAYIYCNRADIVFQALDFQKR